MEFSRSPDAAWPYREDWRGATTVSTEEIGRRRIVARPVNAAERRVRFWWLAAYFILLAAGILAAR
jgi:hypothetical protein